MKLIPFLFLFMVLTGCASQKREEEIIKDKVSKETGSKESLGNTINDLISSSKTLTDAQKTELSGIFEANKQKAFALSEESYKLRNVLVKELLSGSINQKRIKLLKKDIKKVEQLRLKNTFETVEKVGAIVSKDPNSQMFTDHLLFMERPFR